MYAMQDLAHWVPSPSRPFQALEALQLLQPSSMTMQALSHPSRTFIVVSTSTRSLTRQGKSGGAQVSSSHSIRHKHRPDCLEIELIGCRRAIFIVFYIVVRPYSALSSIQSVHRTAFIGVSIAVGLFDIVVLITRKWPSTTHTLQTAQTTDRRDSVAMLETDDMVAFSKSQLGRAVYPPTIRAYTSFRDPMATQIYAPTLSSLTTTLQRPQCTAYGACTNKHALVHSSTSSSRLKFQERVTE